MDPQTTNIFNAYTIDEHTGVAYINDEYTNEHYIKDNYTNGDYTYGESLDGNITIVEIEKFPGGYLDVRINMTNFLPLVDLVQLVISAAVQDDDNVAIIPNNTTQKPGFEGTTEVKIAFSCVHSRKQAQRMILNVVHLFYGLGYCVQMEVMPDIVNTTQLVTMLPYGCVLTERDISLPHAEIYINLLHPNASALYQADMAAAITPNLAFVPPWAGDLLSLTPLPEISSLGDGHRTEDRTVVQVSREQILAVRPHVNHAKLEKKFREPKLELFFIARTREHGG